MTVVSWSPSSTESSTPVTVTCWVAFQLSVVNVNVAGDTVASPVSADDTVNTTLEVGWVSSTTVNVAIEPASVTVAVVPDRVYPAVSSSDVVVAVTVWSARPSKALSLLSSSTAIVTVVSWSPSSTESSTPVTVTCWVAFQLPVVNVNVDADTVASSVSPEATDRTTLLDGSESSTTVNVLGEPPSVTDAVVVDNVNPTASSSTFVTAMTWSGRPS